MMLSRIMFDAVYINGVLNCINPTPLGLEAGADVIVNPIKGTNRGHFSATLIRIDAPQVSVE